MSELKLVMSEKYQTLAQKESTGNNKKSKYTKDKKKVFSIRIQNEIRGKTDEILDIVADTNENKSNTFPGRNSLA